MFSSAHKTEICEGSGLHDLNKVPMKQSADKKDFLFGSKNVGVAGSDGLSLQHSFIVITWKGAG